jgi:hypothetical protein
MRAKQCSPKTSRSNEASDPFNAGRNVRKVITPSRLTPSACKPARTPAPSTLSLSQVPSASRRYSGHLRILLIFAYTSV